MIAPETPQQAAARRRFVAELGRFRASAAAQNAALMRVQWQEAKPTGPELTRRERWICAMLLRIIIAWFGLEIVAVGIAIVLLWESFYG
jgi:hypothetical protein